MSAGREVTAQVADPDIRDGVPGSVTDTHPVALAVRRALALPPAPGCYVRVGADWFYIQAGSFYESHDLPAGSSEWNRRFDTRRPVRPFEFTFTTAWGDQ